MNTKSQIIGFRTWLVAPALLALAGLLTVGYSYFNSMVSVTLVVDGAARQVRTHQNTVENVLRETGVDLHTKDIVEPSLDNRIANQQIITVQHARHVNIRADGQTIKVRTHQTTTQAILDEMDIAIAPQDIVEILTDDSQIPNQIYVKRAIPIIVQENSKAPQRLYTTAATVGEALNDADIVIYLADEIRPLLSSPIKAEIFINIDRSVPVTINVDGHTLRTRTHQLTVERALAELGITLQGLDHTRPDIQALLETEQSIYVVRVKEEILVQQEPIPFETQWATDPDLELDMQQLGQEGQSGVYERRVRVRYENGQEVDRHIEAEWVVRQPIPKIYNYGTKIVLRTVNTPSGPMQYWRKMRMYATSYSAATAGKASTHPTFGITALGWQMRFGIVAVDPRVVRLGSQVYVPNYGVGDAADTGGAIKGRRIDLGYDDANLTHWASCVEVYLLAPAPANIDYVMDFPPHPWCP